jgi:hypothetical protein
MRGRGARRAALDAVRLRARARGRDLRHRRDKSRRRFDAWLLDDDGELALAHDADAAFFDLNACLLQSGEHGIYRAAVALDDPLPAIFHRVSGH